MPKQEYTPSPEELETQKAEIKAENQKKKRADTTSPKKSPFEKKQHRRTVQRPTTKDSTEYEGYSIAEITASYISRAAKADYARSRKRTKLSKDEFDKSQQTKLSWLHRGLSMGAEGEKQDKTSAQMKRLMRTQRRREGERKKMGKTSEASIAEISKEYIGRAADADVERHRKATGVGPLISKKIPGRDALAALRAEPEDELSFGKLASATRKREQGLKDKRQKLRNRRFNRKASEIDKKTEKARNRRRGRKDDWSDPSLKEQAEFIRSLPSIDEQGWLVGAGKLLKPLVKPVTGALKGLFGGAKKAIKGTGVAGFRGAKRLARVTKRLGGEGARFAAWQAAAAPWRAVMAGKNIAKKVGQRALNVKQPGVDTREQLEYIHDRLVEKILGEEANPMSRRGDVRKGDPKDPTIKAELDRLEAIKQARIKKSKKKVSKKAVTKHKHLFDVPRGYRGVRREETEHEGPSLGETSQATKEKQRKLNPRFHGPKGGTGPQVASRLFGAGTVPHARWKRGNVRGRGTPTLDTEGDFPGMHLKGHGGQHGMPDPDYSGQADPKKRPMRTGIFGKIFGKRTKRTDTSTEYEGPTLAETAAYITEKKKGGWIKSAAASIERRGTEGKCTPITKPGCTGRAKVLAQTFKEIGKKRDKAIVSKKEKRAKGK